MLVLQRFILLTAVHFSCNKITQSIEAEKLKKTYFNKYEAESFNASLLWGVFITLALTFISWHFREVLTPNNILLVYLLGVFFVALRFGFWPSILASLTIIPTFAYFIAPPIFSLTINDPEYISGLMILLGVATITSNLAKDIRHKAYMAEQREWRTSALYNLSKELAEARKESEIIEIGVRHIQAEFGVRNTFIFPDDSYFEQFPITQSLDNPPLWVANLNMAEWVFNHGQVVGKGTNNFPNENAIYVPMNGSTGIIGVLALDAINLSKDFLSKKRPLLDTYMYQIAHTLERANSVELAKNATLKMQAETLRNSLLSSISHDLRNPLATIVGAACTLEMDEDRLDKISRKKLVSIINEEAQRMSDLTIKILEMARLEAGEVVLNRQWYAVEEIIGSALRRLDKNLKTRPVNIQLEINLPLIYIDAVLLQQVIVNLLDNANKYSPELCPIDISVVTTVNTLVISVVDRGFGIPEEFHIKIFDKFFRVNEESAQSGVGLGLSICRAIVEAHGGEIKVSNRSGGGSHFEFNLPFLECPPIIDLEEKELML